MNRRVKITGIGPVTPAGVGRQAFEDGINEAVSRVVRLEKIEGGDGDFVGAQILNWKMSDWTQGYTGAKRLPRQTQFAVTGTYLALSDAGIRPTDLQDIIPFVLNGSSLMDPELMMKSIQNATIKGPRHALPKLVFEAPPSATAGKMAEVFTTKCNTQSLQNACCAGLDAIGVGAQAVSSGQTDIAVCCGTEAPLWLHPMIELGQAKLSPKNTSNPSEMGRPFDLWRNTGVIGEGACVLILEPEASPRPAYAFVEGYAYGNDSKGRSGNGLEQTMRMAIANARMRAGDIDLINAWGPGHIEIDRVEAECLQRVFGGRLQEIAAVSLKGAIGNPLGAAGAIQAASAALTLKHGRLPPTVNWKTPDPECPLNLGRSERPVQCRSAIVNAHGLSGTNASLVLVSE